MENFHHKNQGNTLNGIFWNCEGQYTQQFAKTQESFPKKIIEALQLTTIEQAAKCPYLGMSRHELFRQQAGSWGGWAVGAEMTSTPTCTLQ